MCPKTDIVGTETADPALSVEDTAAARVKLLTQHKNVTRVHKKWYDLTGFEHPGGPAALDHMYRRDGTVLFEMHHPLSDRKHLFSTLAKYEITEPKGLAAELEVHGESFKWPENPVEMSPFRTDVVNATKAYFQKEAKRRGITVRQAMKPTPLYWGVMAGLFLGSVYLYLFHFLAGEAWSLIPMVPMTFVWSLTMTHEGCHFALSTDWRINLLGSHLSPWLVSSWSWAVQHVIGHHANTNIPAADPDLYHAPANWRYAPDVPWSEMHQNQALIFPIIWSLATFSTAGINELQNPKHYNEVTAMEPRPFWAWGGAFVEIPGRVIAMSLVLYAPMLYFVFLPAYTLSAFMTVVILPTLLWFGLSIFFMAFSQVSHLDEDSIEQSDEDYFKHEVMTTQDYAPDSYFWLFYSVGLNLQAVHHLFPTISYAHHMSLHPILEEVCKKHNVLYSVFPTYSDVFWRYHAQLAKFANNPETYSPDKHPEVGFDFSKILVAISKLANGGTKASIEANDEAAAPNVLAKLPKVIGGITAIVFTLVMLFDTVAATPGAEEL